MQIFKQAIFIFTILLSTSFFGQEETTFDNIKTIIVKPNIVNTYAPIIKLNETLSISFDDLNTDMEDYTYKITHCDFNWKPSRLSDTEYVVGFADDRIRDYEVSFNTLLPYVNYRFRIPNKNTRIKITGNYLISVLNEDEEIVFTRKFVVYKETVTVGVGIYRGRSIIDRDEKQSVQFSVNLPNMLVNNPEQEIKTVILKNNNWKEAITNVKPQFIRGNQLLYKYDKETSFWGANEYLYFDTKSIRIAGPNIHSVRLGEDIYDTYLYIDEQQNTLYTYAPDVDGNFVIRMLYAEDSYLEADYSWVHFSLDVSEENRGKDIYVNGAFNNWQLENNNKMIFNKEKNLFEVTLLLKQGFYNYQYVTLDANPTTINGSFYQTENDYKVLVYYKKLGSRYQQVVGLGRGNSENIRN